jgi:hypothetical protein
MSTFHCISFQLYVMIGLSTGSLFKQLHTLSNKSLRKHRKFSSSIKKWSIYIQTEKMKDKPSPYLIKHPIRDRKTSNPKTILKELKKELTLERKEKRAQKMKESDYN